MVAVTNPDAEMGPAAMFVSAGIFILIACGILISGLHSRWRDTATWRGLIPRSVPGSLISSTGILIMGVALVVRGVLDQHGPFAGIVRLLFCSGVALVVLAIVYDLARSKRKR
jgi:hypothetical protein